MRSRWLGIALLGSTLLLAAGASGALAQVAAPSIVPGTFTSDNPAAIKWGAPSRIGFGLLYGRSVDEPGGQEADYSGGAAGFRAVGETLAFGFDAAHLADQEDTLKLVIDKASASLALQTGGSIAWGLGYTSSKSSADESESESKEPVFGISVRLGELWFVGASIGRESLDARDTSVSPLIFYGERDTFQYGLGFRRGGTVLMHIEVFGGHKDELKDDGVSFGSEDSTGGTLEFTFGPVLIAAGSTHTKYRDSGNDYSTLTTGDIGWAPRHGFSLVLHYESIYTKFEPSGLPGGDSSKLEIGAVQFTWQF